MTHTASAYLLCRIINIKRYLVIFLVGTILPDILTRGVFYPAKFFLFHSYWVKENLWYLTQPIHTPIGIILVCLLLSYLFEEYQRRTIFIFLCLGAFFHLFLDLFQKNNTNAYLWFFPFSWKSYQIGLFWPEKTLLCIPFLLIAILCVEIVRRKLIVKNKEIL